MAFTTDLFRKSLIKDPVSQFYLIKAKVGKLMTLHYPELYLSLYCNFTIQRTYRPFVNLTYSSWNTPLGI